MSCWCSAQSGALRSMRYLRALWLSDCCGCNRGQTDACLVQLQWRVDSKVASNHSAETINQPCGIIQLSFKHAV